MSLAPSLVGLGSHYPRAYFQKALFGSSLSVESGILSPWVAILWKSVFACGLSLGAFSGVLIGVALSWP